MVEVPRTAVEGFKGSEFSGHADVPELGWFRPHSREAKRGVVLDVEMLKQGLALVKQGG
jgi:hypothetical protein